MEHRVPRAHRAVNAAKDAKQTKDEAAPRMWPPRSARSVRRLQASCVVSDAEKASLGITVAQTARTHRPADDFADLSIECGARLQQTLRFVDSDHADPQGQARGLLGVEIWNKVGTTPPTGEADLRFVAVDTNAPYVMNFDSADGGKTNYVWMRWVSRRANAGRGVSRHKRPSRPERFAARGAASIQSD